MLGMEPVRLPILFDDGQCLVLAKPAGVLVQADSWFPRLPVLIEAIRYQAARGKPEFERLGIGPEGLWAVHDLDPECAGPVLFCRERDHAEELRNAWGSGQFRFTFGFLSQGKRQEPAFECDLPLARHTRMPRMLVSHTTGKKSDTHFLQGESLGAYRLWFAVSAYPRRHQILLHALESGLPVLGDTTYAGSEPVLLSHFKRDYQAREDREERPLYPGPAIFLRELAWPGCEPVYYPEPPRWQALVRQLARHSRG